MELFFYHLHRAPQALAIIRDLWAERVGDAVEPQGRAGKLQTMVSPQHTEILLRVL